MKKLFRFLTPIVIIFVYVACAGTGSNKVVTNTKMSFNQVKVNKSSTSTTEFRIGSERYYVFDTLGRPDKIFYGNENYPSSTLDADAYHIYDNVGLSFRIFGNEVKEITLLNSEWIGSNGLIVGMSKKDMLAILGDGFMLQDINGKDIYSFPDYFIMIEVSDDTDRITEINIQEGN